MSILTRQVHTDNRQSVVQQFNLPDASLHLWPQWLEPQRAFALQLQLEHELQWAQDSIMMFGRSVKIPRQQVWMGEPHCQYRYSGVTFLPQPWHPIVQQLAIDVSDFLQRPFNCVLLNLYANGQQHMGWHADNEPELGHDPFIASISVGAARRFEFKHRSAPWQLAMELMSGSLLTMSAGCQQHWLHRLPKQSKINQGRLNLTFRYIEAKP
ncbi:alpha-ketoglutarate-dependent dioxygenase AlkB family protein [Rheinheimera baltica]|uniref:alpha-ketoglutarate-dependent dioxygenase AlkB family protein n=1 Tax=Rheinheimera baltica TaxID=67576 RepID=UPI00273EDC24|nr:alpha-ketoglutarate-dependent dioxygenase AlkB [Rheinheimera baltica]MDP5151787.1 alpha-ketoglutarate-dependent dioxygenase AlkB [Rheinheimera baltica]